MFKNDLVKFSWISIVRNTNLTEFVKKRTDFLPPGCKNIGIIKL